MSHLAATGITIYLENDGRLKHAQQMAGHESPRTTKLYDRRKDEITLSEVERIRLLCTILRCVAGPRNARDAQYGVKTDVQTSNVAAVQMSMKIEGALFRLKDRYWVARSG
jgi:hypothetical protein